MLIFNSTLASILGYRIRHWLTCMGAGLASGRFRFCRNGAFVPTSGHAGLVSTVFAAKILYTTGNWHHLDENIKADVTAFISSFQAPDGFFRDPWLIDASRHSGIPFDAVERIISAETRQALSLLFSLNTLPPYPIPLVLKDADHARRYMRSLDWHNPWGACSHFSHQCFFLAASRATGQSVPNNIEECLLDELFSHYDKKSAIWHINYHQISDSSISINGLMKMFTGLAWLNVAVYHLIDLDAIWEKVCEHVTLSDSCSLFNHLYVFTTISKMRNNNMKNGNIIKKFCNSYLLSLMQFYKLFEGAFSFFPGKSQAEYYGVLTSSGANCADLHGTVMHTWALSLLLELMGVDSEWKSQRV